MEGQEQWLVLALLLQCHSFSERMLYRRLQLTLHLMKIKGIWGDHILGVSILLGVDGIRQKFCDILRRQKDVGVFARHMMMIGIVLAPTPWTNPWQTNAGVSQYCSFIETVVIAFSTCRWCLVVGFEWGLVAWCNDRSSILTKTGQDVVRVYVWTKVCNDLCQPRYSALAHVTG